MPADIIDNETLRKLSGKDAPSAVLRWAEAQGIRTLQGAGGPFTTHEALNQAMGIATVAERVYRPEEIA